MDIGPWWRINVRVFRSYGLFVGLLSVSTLVHAVPSLVVGTDNGYICEAGETCDWQAELGPIIPGPFHGVDEGFIIGASGDGLSIITNILGADIWLLTTADVFALNNPLINGIALTLIPDPDDPDQFDGYQPTPYYGINLGQVDTTDSWVPFDPYNPSPFFLLDVILTYSGQLDTGIYFFAVANDNLLAGLQANEPGPDSFSPKTASAVAISEPSTITLLGVGFLLIGLGFAKRRSA